MLNDLKLNRIQRNIDDTNNIAKNFLTPALSEAISYDRSTGFFSINVLLELFSGLLPFIKNGGVIRCLTSVELQQNDFDCLSDALLRKQNTMKAELEELIDAELKLSEEEIDKLDIITNLIAIGRIDFKFVCLEKGMFHEKTGILTDAHGNSIYFIGSANLSLHGAIYNRESIHLSFSWKDAEDAQTVIEEREYFNRLWNSTDEHLKVFSFPAAVREKLFNKYKISNTLDEACSKYLKKYGGIQQSTGGREIRDYQKRAIDNFIKNDGHAFFEMATGTGKTFTAIEAVKTFIEEKHDKFLVIILVPLVDLLEQWNQVLRSEGINAYGIGGDSDPSDMQDVINDFYTFPESRYVICVYKSFFSKFCDIISRIRNTKNIVIVVDEAHNLTPNYLKNLPLNTKYRLGLSATPARYSEKETLDLMSYFLRPGEETFKYSLEQAIHNGYLSHYKYYPLSVRLSFDEMDKYEQLTKSIAALINKEKRTTEEEERLTNYLNMRAQVVKHAESKFELLEEMVNSEQYDFTNSVVYCGRGAGLKDYDTASDKNGKSIERIIEILNKNPKLVVSSFIDKTHNRKMILKGFEDGDLTTLVAIKCLDEGVDIPSLGKLYVLASDGSTRQTIQRRGRVLRICKEKGKDTAYIYDMIALPPDDCNDAGTSLIISELSRVLDYASLADNRSECETWVNNIQNKFKFSMEEYAICQQEIQN